MTFALGLMVGTALGVLVMALLSARRVLGADTWSPADPVSASAFAALCAERGLPPDATARKLWGRQ